MIHLSKIDKYFLWSTTKLAFYFTIVPTVIMWIVQSRQIFELGLGRSISLWIILKLSLLLIPPILPHIIPFAVLLAIITLIVRSYSDSELVVLFTSGLSPYRLSKSFVILGFLMMIVVLCLNIFVNPALSKQLRIELFNVKNDIVRSILKPGLIQTPTKNVTLFIKEIQGDSYIKGFYLQQTTPKNEHIIFTADEALLTEKNKQFHLLLIKGRILYWVNTQKTQNKDHNEKDKIFPSVLDFNKFTMNLTDIIKLTEETQEVVFKARDYSLKELLSGNISSVPSERNRYFAKGHELIISSFYVLTFTALVLYQLLRPFAPRGFPYQLILKTVASAVLLRVLGSGMQNLVAFNLNYIYLSYALPILVFIIMIAILYHFRRSKL